MGPARRSTSTTASSRYYVVPRDKKSHITKLKGLLKDADELYLATDEDREGEAIAWHLLDELKPKDPGAPDGLPRDHQAGDPGRGREPARARHGPRRGPGGAPHPRPPLRLRGLARCCGRRSCPASPPAACSRSRPGWSSTGSASGCAFRVASYWDLEGTFDAGAEHDQRMFPAKLHSVDGARVARGSDFGHDGAAQGRRRAARSCTSTEPRAEALAAALQDTTFDGPLGRVQALPPLAVRAVPHHHAAAGGQPQARLQRLARRCRWRSGCTRTASSPTCVPTPPRCRAPRSTRPGPRSASCTAPSTCPTRPRTYARKVKNAQEAHEAIRPAGDSFRTPAQTGLTGDAVPALRADLDAHRRLADEGRRRPVGHDPARRRRLRPARTSCSPPAAG